MRFTLTNRDDHNLTLLHSVPGSVLILVDGDRTCAQIREVLSGLDMTVIKPEAQERMESMQKQSKGVALRRRLRTDSEVIDLDEEENPGNSGSSMETGPDQSRVVPRSTRGSGQLLRRLLRNYFRWKGGLSKVKRNLFKKGGQKMESSRDGGTRGNPAPARGRGAGRGNAPPNKRRRVRGGASIGTSNTNRHGHNDGESALTTTFEEEAAEVAALCVSTSASKSAKSDK